MRLPIIVFGACLFMLGITNCSKSDDGHRQMAPDGADAGNASSVDAATRPVYRDTGMPVGMRDDASPPLLGTPDDGLSFGIDQGIDGNPSNQIDQGLGGTRGQDRGLGVGGGSGGECPSELQAPILVTSGDGQSGDVVDVILNDVEDGGGDFSLGLRLAGWREGSAISLQVNHGETLIARGMFSETLSQCQADGTWQTDSLELRPLPSVEIDDIIDLDLTVTGEIQGAEGEESAQFQGVIRLQY